MVKKVVKMAEEVAERIIQEPPKPNLKLKIVVDIEAPHDCLSDFGSVVSHVRKAADALALGVNGSLTNIEIKQ